MRTRLARRISETTTLAGSHGQKAPQRATLGRTQMLDELGRGDVYMKMAYKSSSRTK